MMGADRQYGELNQIRADHVKRYEFAATRVRDMGKVLDAACGCGYGSWMLGTAGNKVLGVDICEEAIDYANQHYPGPTYLQADAHGVADKWDAITSFETLEHLERPEVFLSNNSADILIASVPNEILYPFRASQFAGDEYPHRRHYTPTQFESLLTESGWTVDGRFCQEDKHSAVLPGIDGMFLIYVAHKAPNART